LIEVDLLDAYHKFKELKDNSDKFSKMRKCCFTNEDFNYKILNEETQEDTTSYFYKKYLVYLTRMHTQLVYYNNWSKTKKLIKLCEEDDKPKIFTVNNCVNINSNVNYENDSIGRSLLIFCADLIKERRIDNRNDLIYTINNFDGVFNDNIDLFTYEFMESEKYKIESPKVNNENEKKEETNLQRKLSDIKSKKSAPLNDANPSEINSLVPTPSPIKQSLSSQVNNVFLFKNNVLNQDNQDNQNNIINKENISHPILSEQKEHIKVDSSMSKCDKNSSPFNIIIDYHDDIYKIYL
jgi:hypothetical protein